MKVRILHLEDDPEWQSLVRRTLTEHTVVTADSYGEAVLRLREGPTFEVAIVDLNLENRMDGWGREFLDVLIAGFPGTRRIAMTGSTSGSMSELIQRYGLVDVIIKGEASAPGLVHVIDKALHGQVPQLSNTAHVQLQLRQAILQSRRAVEARIDEGKEAGEKQLAELARVSKASQDRARSRLQALEALRQKGRASYDELDAFAQSVDSDSDAHEFRNRLSRVEDGLLADLSSLPG